MARVNARLSPDAPASAAAARPGPTLYRKQSSWPLTHTPPWKYRGSSGPDRVDSSVTERDRRSVICARTVLLHVAPSTDGRSLVGVASGVADRPAGGEMVPSGARSGAFTAWCTQPVATRQHARANATSARPLEARVSFRAQARDFGLTSA